MKRIEPKRRRAAFACAAAALLAVACAAFVFGRDAFALFFDGARVQAWVDAQGPAAPLAMAALIAVQVVVAVLPGEPLELGAGYAFGFWEGTALCLVASLAATLVVVALVRTLGMKAAEAFFPREKIASMKWLQDSARFELLMFLCFLIPGSPKDVMTYVAGLTTCPAWRIAAIATVGRIPSVVSSTMAAGLAASGSWAAAGAVVAATVAMAATGVGLYALVARRERAAARRTLGSGSGDARFEERGRAAGSSARRRALARRGFPGRQAMSARRPWRS